MKIKSIPLIFLILASGCSSATTTTEPAKVTPSIKPQTKIEPAAKSATNIEPSFSMAKWEQSGGSYVAMTFVANKGGTVKSIMAKIENNNGGQQVIAFYNFEFDGDDFFSTCSTDDFNKTPSDGGYSYTSSSIWNINGANVKMFTQCMTDTDSPYLRAAPLSDKAKKYVTDLFRTKEAVIVNRGAMVEKMPVSAVGFLDAWNSSGGDAI